MTFKTEAIVLYERPFAGADKLYELLSPRYGKISAVGRSAAKSTSKLAGHMRPFSHLSVMIGRGKNDHLAAVSEIRRFNTIHTSFSDFILASSLVELIMRVNVPDQAAPLEFELLYGALASIDDKERTYAEKVLVGRVFLWKLVALAGWEPLFDQCALCRKKMSAEEVYFDEMHGFVCIDHRNGSPALDAALILFLQKALVTHDWNSIMSEASQLTQPRQWFDLSQKYYHHVINQPIRSLALFSYV